MIIPNNRYTSKRTGLAERSHSKPVTTPRHFAQFVRVWCCLLGVLRRAIVKLAYHEHYICALLVMIAEIVVTMMMMTTIRKAGPRYIGSLGFLRTTIVCIRWRTNSEAESL